MSCGFPRFVPNDGEVAQPGQPPRAPQGATMLVSDRDTRPVLTANRETDARTALTRGLAEYLEQLVIDWSGGRTSMFRKVLSTYAEPEELAEYPSAVVYSPAAGSYDASSFTPVVSTKNQLALPDGRFLVKTSEFKLDEIRIEAWCTDPKERQALAAMLEDALSPVEFMHGVRLALPHYHGVHADFEMASQTYLDSEDTAMRRYRIVVVTVRSSVSVLRVAELPIARPVARVVVSG